MGTRELTEPDGSATRFDALVREDRVHRSVYTDPDVFATEMSRVYAAVWTYVGHASELERPNEFRTRTLGTRPVIFVRDADGELRVLLNRCRHRGATVCRVGHGRAKRFVCPYHGWSYRSDGTLAGMPWPSGYGEIDKSKLGLGRARVGVYRDFVFATLNPDAPELEEYLGAARPLLDQWIDRFPEGRVSVRSGAHRMEGKANWKLVFDNAVDGYHPAFSHRSLLQTAERLGENKDMTYFGESPDESPMLVQYLGNGHTFLDQRPLYLEAGAYWDQQRPQPGREAYEATVRQRHGDRAVELLDLAVGSQMNLNIFPNLLIIGNQIQVLEPLAVDRTLLTWYATTSDALPGEITTLRMRTQEDFPSFGEPDDLANFAECQRGLQIPELEWVMLNRGFGIEGRVKGNGSGPPIAPVTDEWPMRGYFDEWRRLMSTDVSLEAA